MSWSSPNQHLFRITTDGVLRVDSDVLDFERWAALGGTNGTHSMTGRVADTTANYTSEPF